MEKENSISCLLYIAHAIACCRGVPPNFLFSPTRGPRLRALCCHSYREENLVRKHVCTRACVCLCSRARSRHVSIELQKAAKENQTETEEKSRIVLES